MKAGYRNKSGFSLPTVAALGIVAGLWMLGTAAMVVPGMGRITVERARDVARSSAEASLDWGVQQMNNPVTRATIDSKSNVSVPSTLMGAPNFRGTLTVTNVAPPLDSYLYDPNCDPSRPDSTIQGGGNHWRVLTATVTPNQLSNGTTRTVRVILKPIYTTTAGETVWVPGPKRPMFPGPMSSPGQIGGVGNTITNSYDSRQNPNPSVFDNYDGDVSTNTSLSISGNTSIGGDASVTNTPGNTADVVSGSGNAKIHGDISSNGGVGSHFDSKTNVGGQVTENASNDPMQFAPTPAAPSGAADLGSALNIAGNNTITLSAKGATLANKQFIPTSNGSFIANSISITGNAKIVIDPQYGPVNLHIEGAGSNAGINIAGNGFAGTVKPSDLRIWYGGTGDTKVAGNGSTRALIFAPNSTYKQVGNGEVYGAIVANKIDLTGNAKFHYDRALRDMNDLMFNPQIPNTPLVKVVDHYQAVSWDEF